MCGFLGSLRTSQLPWSENERALQQRALSETIHRGPDDMSEAIGDGWWMGFRRLSILDLSEHARQPMTFENGRYTLTFNGEIYNYRELKRDLGSTSTESSGDTIVLGMLIARDGIENVLPRLRGMFALAWRDNQTGTLTLARDHFGIKPLYWSDCDAQTIHYGSELRGVKRLVGVKESSRDALMEYMRWGSVQAPHTMFDGIHCLPPGNLLEWRSGQFTIHPWFSPEWPSADAWIGDPALQLRGVREGVLASVRAHLISDVPVGVFLSGGLDSTIIAACMRECGLEKIKAFSIGYENNSGVTDETDAAERSAKHFGCTFTRERFNADKLEDKLDHYFDSMDQPTGDGLNTWLVSQLAARDVKVALSGLGADEWWAGYNHHRLAAVAAKSPFKFAGSFARKLNQHLPPSVNGKPAWKALFYALGGAGKNPQEWQAQARTILATKELTRLFCGKIPGLERQPSELSHSTHWLHELLLLETRSYLANTLLRDNDWASMAHSLELRVPLVDAKIFALAGTIPPSSKLTSHGGKIILRESFRDLLPTWIYDDRQKKTFTLPLMKWMRLPSWQNRIRDTLDSQQCRQRGLFDHESTAKLCNDYFTSNLESKSAWNLSQRVWLMYVFEEWAKRNLDI